MGSEGSFSDLSELESDAFDDGLPKKSKSKSKSKASASYKLRSVLKVSRSTTYTAQALYQQIHNEDINLEPEYQRDVVWTDAKQMGLIDSIFRNFYIPPIIFAAHIQDDGSETKTCIDGKQRLTSIQKFMGGHIPYKDPITAERLWYKDISEKRNRILLPEKYRRMFANKQIVCVEYHDITEGDEREIFQRVQLGMALTPAEKLQVINTPRSQFVRELQNSFFRPEGGLSEDYLEWDRSRGSDFRCIAQFLCCLSNYGPSMKSLTIGAQLEKWLSKDDELPDSFVAKAKDTYNIFAELVQDEKLKVAFQNPSKVSPVEFVATSLLISVHKDKLSLPQLSTLITLMRKDVRKVHVDIRLNTRVGRTMLEFIQAKSGAGKEAMKNLPKDDGPRPSASKSLKRKHPGEDEEKEGKSKKVSKPQTPKKAPPDPKVPDRLAVLRATKNSLLTRRSPNTSTNTTDTIPATGPNQALPPSQNSPRVNNMQIPDQQVDNSLLAMMRKAATANDVSIPHARTVSGSESSDGRYEYDNLDHLGRDHDSTMHYSKGDSRDGHDTGPRYGAKQHNEAWANKR